MRRPAARHRSAALQREAAEPESQKAIGPTAELCYQPSMIADDAALSDPPPSDTGLPPSPFGTHQIPHRSGEPVWVFGYGSLMWNPGFRFVDRRDATLYGYHRRFCVYSFRYRGTPEAPGLVLGLDRGGSCRGVAFKIAPEDKPLALQYLWDREMVNGVYRPTEVRLRITSAPDWNHEHSVIDASTFVVDRDHQQYCPELSPDTAATLIATRRGQNGPNADYLLNTVAHLTAAGITNTALHRLAARVTAISTELDTHSD
ncbi:gamma-glutamylcyclotransferase [Fodinicurvata sp. EGI_FJ10296]|uniref:gamma-glutamylcyclotransferase n=1 Tax=Fodinicurvata sp. EGI_FJ10296 TaxID=3231908 RepID=UPI003453616D